MVDSSDATPSVRRSRRTLGVAVVAAVCVVGLAVWAGVALVDGDRQVRLEATTSSGTATSIVWRGPADASTRDANDDPMSVVETPWSVTIEVADGGGMIHFNVIAATGADAGCRVLLGDKVIAEDAGRLSASCGVFVPQASASS